MKFSSSFLLSSRCFCLPYDFTLLGRNNSDALRFLANRNPNARVSNRFSLSPLCSLKSGVPISASNPFDSNSLLVEEKRVKEDQWRGEIRSPVVPPFVASWLPNFSLSDRAFFLLSFIACTTSLAFASLVIVAVPTLFAMGRAANALAKLADTAREELPSTMAAVRLSSMEISDLTLELSDLSQEISEGVTKSTQAVQAAEAGVKQIGAMARKQTISMIEERANLPPITLQPVVSGAARKTSRAVSHATRAFMNLISRVEISSQNSDDEDEVSERLDL